MSRSRSRPSVASATCCRANERRAAPGRSAARSVHAGAEHENGKRPTAEAPARSAPVGRREPADDGEREPERATPSPTPAIRIPARWTPITKRWIWMSWKPGRTSMRGPERRAAEEQQQAEQPKAPSSARAADVAAGLHGADHRPRRANEERDDREAARVEQLAREQPAEDLAARRTSRCRPSPCRTRSASSTWCRRSAARAPRPRSSTEPTTTSAARPARRR